MGEGGKLRGVCRSSFIYATTGDWLPLQAKPIDEVAHATQPQDTTTTRHTGDH
jgi:hypothetical protein